jgi:hypothetical protein
VDVPPDADMSESDEGVEANGSPSNADDEGMRDRFDPSEVMGPLADNEEY